MLEFLNDISIKRKLIITYLIVVIIPISIIGYFITNKLYKLSFSNATGISNATLHQLKGNYINKFSSYKNILDGLVSYAPLIDFIETFYSSDYEAIDDFKTRISPYIRRLQVDGGEEVIRVYSDNRTIWHSVETSNTLDDLKMQKWFDYSESLSMGNIKWTIAENMNGIPNQKYFGCYRLLRNRQDPDKVSSVIALFFDEKQLFSLISEESEAGKAIFLFNKDGRIITTTERELLFANIGGIRFNSGNSIDDLRNNSIVKYKDRDYLFIRADLNEKKILIDGWTLVCLIPADGILEGISNIWKSSLVLCGICIMISVALTVFVSRNITGRVKSLIVKFGNIVENNFKVKPGPSGKDEIGKLEDNFIQMVGRIRSLINEVYLANLKIKDAELNYQKIQTEKREAEIIALQGQINPHYLFNTLETIRMSLVLSGDRKNADMIEVFAAGFRLCIENKRDIYTLKEELQFLQNYFTIQKYRLRDNINFIVDIPENIMDCMVPKLILQPIVENSVYHGIEMKGECGTVTIRAFESEGDIRIVVCDDGLGIEEALLERLRAELDGADPKEHSGWTKIALKNVHNRLRLMYGETYGLKIDSRSNEGTSVEISLPVMH